MRWGWFAILSVIVFVSFAAWLCFHSTPFVLPFSVWNSILMGYSEWRCVAHSTWVGKQRWHDECMSIYEYIAASKKTRYTKRDSHLLNFVINEISHFFDALKKQFRLDKLKKMRPTTIYWALFALRWTVPNSCANFSAKMNVNRSCTCSFCRPTQI